MLVTLFLITTGFASEYDKKISVGVDFGGALKFKSDHQVQIK